MELEDLSLFIYGVENRVKENKKNTTKEYELEFLRDLGFKVDISKIYIKTWDLSNSSVITCLEQTFLIEFENMDLDHVLDTRETYWVEKDYFSNGKIDLLDFKKVFYFFWVAWNNFVREAKRNVYYYLKRKKHEKIMEEFKSKIAIGYDW